MSQDSYDGKQLQERMVDLATNSLKIDDVGPPSGNNGTNLDLEEIWERVVDPVTFRIRVVFI